LIGRYQLPHPQDPDSPIARHETGLFSEAKEILLKSAKGAHRSDNFNRDILPLALPLVTAIGHRMAFEAAVEANIDSKLIALYRSGVIKEDSAWYVEKGGLSRAIQREMETQAADDLLPQLDEIITTSGMQDYSKAPMTSKALWDDFVDGLVVYTGDAPADLLPWSGPVSLKSRL
jgi:hypothetical protein